MLRTIASALTTTATAMTWAADRLGGKAVDSLGVSNISNPDNWLVLSLGGEATASGMRVSPLTALAVSAVYACVRNIAEDIAKVPLALYRVTSRGARRHVVDHPAYRLMMRKPNAWQTRFTYRETVMTDLLLRGNHYSYLRFDARGNLTAIIPLPVDRVTVLEAVSGEFFYQVSRSGLHEQAQLAGEDLVIVPERIMHLRGLSLDGRTGCSAVRFGAETIGAALAANRYSAKLFANGATPRGVLEHPKLLNPDAVARLRRQWQDLYSGVENAHRVAVLEEGMKFMPVTVNSSDAQLIEARQFSVTDVARLFRMPPHKIGDLAKSTNNNIEHQSLEHHLDCLMPWYERLEAGLDAALLTPEEQDAGFYWQFDVTALLRGDTKARMERAKNLFYVGAMSPDDVRQEEGLNPIPGGLGRRYFVPVNMMPLDAAATPNRPMPAIPTEPLPGTEPEIPENTLMLEQDNEI